MTPAQSAKKRGQRSAVSRQLAIGIQLLNQPREHALQLNHTLGDLGVIIGFDQFQIVGEQEMVLQLTGGTSGNATVARQFCVSILAASFGKVSRDR